MKQKTLFIVFLSLTMFFAGGIRAWGQENVVTVTSSDELLGGSLAEVVNLELSGEWDSEAVGKLVGALHEGGNKFERNFNLKNVTCTEDAVFTGASLSLNYMFIACPVLESVKLPPYSQGIVDLGEIFMMCENLKRVNSEVDGEFDFTDLLGGGIGNLAYAFQSCRKVVSIIMPVFSNAISFSYTFSDCNSLVRVNSEEDVINLTGYTVLTGELTGTFMNCSKAVSIKMPSYSAPGTHSIRSTFLGCTSLMRVNSEVDGVFDLTYSSFDVFDFSNVITNCPKAVSIYLPSSATGSSVTLRYAFSGCSSLQFIGGLKEFEELKDITGAFFNCLSLTSVQLSHVPEVSDYIDKTFTGVNPNCLKYLPADAEIPSGWKSSPGYFIVGEQSAGDITLYDRVADALPGEEGFNPFYCPKQFTLAPGCSIQYSRPAASLAYATSYGGWNTLILPFEATLQVGEVEKSPVTTTQGGDYWLHTFVSATAEGETTFSSTEDGVIQANVPYLFALPGDSFGHDSMQDQEAVFVSAVSAEEAPVTVKASDDVDYSSHENFSYQGVFTPLLGSTAYLLTGGEDESGDSFVLYSKGNSSSFRAYFAEVEVGDGQPSGVRRLQIANGGDVTSLSPVFMEATGAEQAAPRKVWTKEGLRIVKGSKVYTMDGSFIGVAEAE